MSEGQSYPDSRKLKLPLLLEVAAQGGCFAHIPSLPGLCFRADDPASALGAANEHVAGYGRWLFEQGALQLNPEAAALVRLLEKDLLSSVEIVERERLAGSPVWLSGNPAALFQHDRRSLRDAEIAAHMDFTRRVVADFREVVTPLSAAQLAWRRARGQRSIIDTLTHIGNCIWWYCSRIDDTLPEPDDHPAETALDRVDRLLQGAVSFLLEVPFDERALVHVPKRFPTADPAEQWTHAKACRRQAEHVWEHLPGMRERADAARKADL